MEQHVAPCSVVLIDAKCPHWSINLEDLVLASMMTRGVSAGSFLHMLSPVFFPRLRRSLSGASLRGGHSMMNSTCGSLATVGRSEHEDLGREHVLQSTCHVPQTRFVQDGQTLQWRQNDPSHTPMFLLTQTFLRVCVPFFCCLSHVTVYVSVSVYRFSWSLSVFDVFTLSLCLVLRTHTHTDTLLLRSCAPLFTWGPTNAHTLAHARHSKTEFHFSWLRSVDPTGQCEWT